MNNTLMFNYPKQDATFIETIIKVVSNHTSIPVAVMQQETRKREIVFSRQLAMQFSKCLTKASLAKIGSEIGGKDHATVLHACKTVDNLYDTDSQIRGLYNNIYAVLGEKIRSISNEFIVCAECGSQNLLYKTWVNVNTGELLNKEWKAPEYYCYECKKYVDYITKEEYEKETKDNGNTMETISDSM